MKEYRYSGHTRYPFNISYCLGNKISLQGTARFRSEAMSGIVDPSLRQ
jgi:hypothetical protein